ncbi:eukaryotic translation initiation factor 2-alpha kinase 3 [Patella vulgata]|uniref:eukaryotic translation initiation factor 2-alpha kinase 3 n=1 Tax=Patella vulgata TaxID=6465 RepID=UPI00217FDFBD|nr:eukaryotic translation initiation factor 2-alpha kinase 3 [Patella vulgata]
MGWKKVKKWFPRLIGVIASLSALCIGSGDGLEEDGAKNSNVFSNTCKPIKKDNSHMFVSTLDGRLSALDIRNDGELLWSVQADARPLLSSSIGKLELNRNGVRTRLIPSLDGGLYQYDGESIEAVPMTAEKLLSSTFRLDDNTMMIGGKDSKSYGVDANTGQVRYVCSMEGCKFLGDGEVTDDEDVIVIKRNTQTVRAVDARSGVERWNFSVGNHELDFVDGTPPIPRVDDEDDDGITITTCQHQGDHIEEDEQFNTEHQDEALKIIVPEGRIVALNPADEAHILWQHKFSSPVTNAWILKKGMMKRVSLFDNRHIPALSSFTPEGTEELDDVPKEPLLYVGMHQNQLYVQPSITLTDDERNSDIFVGNPALPQISWRPYLSSSTSRTPIFHGNHKDKVPLLGDKSTESGDKSLIVWHEHYPFDNGYYLYPDVTPLLPVKNLTPEADSIMYIPQSLHYWWKEVIAISLITSVVLHVILNKFVKKDLPNQQSGSSSNDMINTSQMHRTDSENSETHSEFASRFSSEFEFVHSLGKGGFGVVFEAKNKIDECHYAVKRITLSNSVGAKDRVMREVRALAKLDNPGIVRYFNAWMENPPLGWIDSLEKCLEDSECFTPTPCNSGTDLCSLPLKQNRMFVLGSSATEWGVKCGNSATFEVHGGDDLLLTDESGSYSIGTCDRRKHSDVNEDSFQIEFANSYSESNNSSSRAKAWEDTESFEIPFQNYQDKNMSNNDNSFSVVFEDSGCRDKSSKGSQSTDVLRSQDNVLYKPDSTCDKDTNDNEALKKVVVQKSNAGGNLYLYIQMQLCRRETLKDWLCANTLNRDRETVLDIFDQIVEAVDYVHKCGLIHRDLKPSNIFFSIDGAIKIGDFGLVTGLEKQSDEYFQAVKDGSVVKHTAEVGTQLYMSPEQVARSVYDHKVDIFSMGMILFELFYPFSTQMERIKTLVDVKKHVFPQRFIKEMPNESKFVKWLLALKSHERPTTSQILDSELLKDFACRRSSNRFRSRTISDDSSSSVKAS